MPCMRGILARAAMKEGVHITYGIADDCWLVGVDDREVESLEELYVTSGQILT